jgi:hypothetical protein
MDLPTLCFVGPVTVCLLFKQVCYRMGLIYICIYLQVGTAVAQSVHLPGYELYESGFHYWQGKETVRFSDLTRKALGLCHSPVHWVNGAARQFCSYRRVKCATYFN